MRNMPSDGQAVQCLRACSGEARLKIIMKCELPGARVAFLDESHRKELRNGSGLGLSRNEGNLEVSNEGWCEEDVREKTPRVSRSSQKVDECNEGRKAGRGGMVQRPTNIAVTLEPTSSGLTVSAASKAPLPTRRACTRSAR